MADANQPAPTLAGLFAQQILAQYVRKPLFGKPYLTSASVLMTAAWVYQCCAILGRARSRFLPLLLEMCSGGPDPEHVRRLEDAARQEAPQRLRRFRGSPTDFADFYLTTEAARVAGKPLFPGEGYSLLLPLSKDKVALDDTNANAKLWAASVDGVVFGTMYPERVQTMASCYSESHADAQRVAAALLDPHRTAPKPSPTFDQLEQEVLASVAHLAAQSYPHLLKRLKLPP
jgi:hypothetical protein